MDKRDLELILKYGEQDAEVKSLYDNHVAYERIIDKLESKPYRNANEELEIKELKKKKLAGKTRLEAILIKYRKSED